VHCVLSNFVVGLYTTLIRSEVSSDEWNLLLLESEMRV